MKTLTEKISEKLAKANEFTAKANEHSKKAKEHQAKIRSLILLFTVIITINLSGQSFEKINGLGKNEIGVIQTANQQGFFVNRGLENGVFYEGYRFTDLGSTKYYFKKINGQNICCSIKVILNLAQKLEINKMVYDVKVKYEKTRTVYYITYR